MELRGQLVVEEPGEKPVRLAQVTALAVPERRLLGAYYTPEPLAEALVAWALATGPRSVLDPSYGEGVFLRSACRRLGAMSTVDPSGLVHGVDVDPTCAPHIATLGLRASNIRHADFLSLAPDGLSGAPFGAVVGNPPFVRHHWMKGDAKTNAMAMLELAGAQVPGTASSWAYFVVHALQFLAEGGRLALVLPEAVLQADYARSVRALLAQRFARTQLIQLRERVFADTEESVVIVLGEGRGPGEIEVKSVADVAELIRVVEGAETPRHLVTTENGRTVERKAYDVLSAGLKAKCVKPFGEFAQIRIGFVTGANHYFIRAAAELDDLDVPQDARLQVVTRTSWLDGLNFTVLDHDAHSGAGSRAFLVQPRDGAPALRRWLAQGTADGVNNRYKCSDREPWYRVRLADRPPDAFASSTRQGLPRLALNTAGFHCSNTLHMVHWADDLKVDAKAIIVGYHTSLCGLWAELNGRRYGGGVLKVDPGVLQRMPIPVVADAAGAFDEMDRLLRAGDEPGARVLADDVVLVAGLGLSARSISTLRRACTSLADQRLPQRGGRDG